MRKYRVTFIGFSLLAIMLLISLSYPLWGPDDYDAELFFYDENANIIDRAPNPPTLEHPFGTDRNGQDMVLINVFGMKFTILAAFTITALRVFLGVIAGVIIGMWVPRARVYFQYFFIGFRYVPLLIIALFLMGPVTEHFTGISVWVVTAYQIGVLTIIAFPSLVVATIELIDQIKKQSFVLTSTLMGAGKLHVFVKHLWPFLKSYGLLLVVQQLFSTVVILMQLGIFNAFLGGQTEQGIFIGDSSLPETLSNEWAGLIAQNFRVVRFHPWILASTLFCFFFLINLLNMMKKEVEKNFSIDNPTWQPEEKSTPTMEPILDKNTAGNKSFTFLNNAVKSLES